MLRLIYKSYSLCLALLPRLKVDEVAKTIAHLQTYETR